MFKMEFSYPEYMMYSFGRIWGLHQTSNYDKLWFTLPSQSIGLIIMNFFKEATKNKSILFLIVPGIFIILFSLVSDVSRFGTNDIRPAQVLVTIVGATLVLLGVGRMLGSQEHNQAIIPSSWLDEIPNLPDIVWVVMGFSITYMFFLIFPMFFASAHKVVYFNRYLPGMYPIGADFTSTLDSIRTWFAQGVAKVYYPPLLTILFAPLTLMAYPINYYIITTMTVTSYFVVAFLLPFLIISKKDLSIPLFIFGASAFSYGFQFEVERGQFHTIAMLFCLSAIYLFHRRLQERFFAYVLFCISVQFKIYPAVFVVLLVDDWRDWKTNLKRFFALGLTNFLLLFLLGYSYFSKFIAHIAASNSYSEPWLGNHSISSFLTYLLTSKDRFGDANLFAWVESNINLVMNVLVLYFVICLLLVWLNAYRRNTRGIDSLLLMTCVLGALILPSINHDYTLPLLTAPFALIMAEQFTQNVRGRMLVIFLRVAASCTYAITLVPFIHKPVYLQNTFPLLVILLTITTLLSFLRDEEDIESATPPVLSGNSAGAIS